VNYPPACWGVIHFNIFSLALINYPGSWALLLAILAALIFIGLVVLDWWRKKVSPVRQVPLLIQAADSGLAIPKHIVKAHGGEIHVVSGLGCCYTFIFTLPVSNHL
jgi:hypothetical protein